MCAPAGPLIPSIHLNTNQLVVKNEAVILSAVLGTCVSVCLFSKKKCAGGMVQYSLPRPPPTAQRFHLPSEDTHFGSLAIAKLIREMLNLTDESPSQWQAKIVGGGADASQPRALILAAENIAMAEKMMREFHIPVIEQSSGGPLERKVRFHLPSGRLQVSPVYKSN